MTIRILGKCDPSDAFLYTREQRESLSCIGAGFVFVDYLDEAIYLQDVFMLWNGTNIILKEIKIQFKTAEPLTGMDEGWKCFCRFDNLDLDNIPAIRYWQDSGQRITATRVDDPMLRRV